MYGPETPMEQAGGNFFNLSDALDGPRPCPPCQALSRKVASSASATSEWPSARGWGSRR